MQPGELTPEKQALLAIRRLKERIAELERAQNEPIAIVGMACRLPGGVSTPEAFWTLLRHGVDAVGDIPPDRWDVDAYYDPDPDAAGKMYTRRGGFLSDIDRFDPRHFGITPREAISMDPQQRLLLEVTWEALERAAQAPDRLSGSATGVFVGISTNDYGQILLRASDQIDPGMYFGTGNLLNAAAGRLSYVLGLQGPSMAVDTACSSSLVAVHLACQSLRHRECRLALAGGANLVLVPEVTVNCCRAKMLAADGRCKTFDEAADGYVRGEGCAMLALKRLSDAVADGDRILALIRGSAVNQDGRSGGFTAPNELAQQAVIQAALRSAGVAPSEIGYVEAHGTGTSLGDPIEMHAIAAALGDGRRAERPLVVGSVKTNVGHLEAAAGVTGLMKVVLALEHEQIPPHLHFRRLNPHIDFGACPIEIPQAARPWGRGGQRRVAGVSSFGFTGTNAHVILEEAPLAPPREEIADRPAHVLMLSARTEAALRETAGRFAAYLDSAGEPLGDICFSAARGRAAFDHRLAAVAASASEAREILDEAANGQTSRLHAAKARSADEGVVFLFTGQGSQYADMGRELYDSEPAFRAAIDRCADALKEELPIPLRDLLYPDRTASALGGSASSAPSASSLNDTQYTQPALFALGYALAETWRSWGVQPSAVAGHSIGEYTAACVAGAIALEDALRLVAARGRLMQRLPPNGAMAAVMASEDRVAAAIGGAAGVAIAALNGPSNTVIAGDAAAVEAVVERLARENVSAQRLTVSHAFHSPLVEPMLDDFERIAASVAYLPLRVPFVSNVTGDFVAPGFAFDAAYWRRHARQPVRFADGITAAYERGDRVFLELGPAPVLSAMAQRVVGENDAAWIPSLRKGRGDWRQMLSAAGELFVRGVALDWDAFDRPYRRRKAILPTYPFQRERYWVDVAPRRPASATAAATGSEDRFYAIRWMAREIDQAAAPVSGVRLIVADANAHAAVLQQALEAAGDTCVRAPIPSTAEEWRVLIDDSRPAADSVVLVVAPEDAADTTQAERACGSIAAYARASRGAASRPPRLFVATGGSQPAAEGETISHAAAPLWGLTRVFALEHPDLWGGSIDLPGEPVLADAGRAADYIRGSHADDQIAIRAGRVYVPRLDRLVPPKAAPLHLPSDATYVITGGFGSIGLALARRLVGRGARSIAMVGRRSLPPREQWESAGADAAVAAQIAAIRGLENAGAVVHLCQVDVTRRDDVSTLFARLREQAPPVRGVFHAAGVSRPADIADMTAAQLAEMFAAKVTGAALLDEATRALPLDYFVLFSSISAAWGSRTLGGYAAANHYLDALAHRRRALGLPALSINWGPWAGSGMMDAAGERWLAAMGVRSLAADAALNALEALMASPHPQAVVADVDWNTFLQVYEAKGVRPFMERLRAPQQPAEATAGSGSLERLSRMLPLERHDALVRLVAGHVEQVVGPGEVGLDDGLFDMGMDSLMATQLRRRLEKDLGRDFPPTLTFDYPSVSRLAGFIERECFAPPAAPPEPPRGPDAGSDLASAIAALEALPDDEAELLLLNRGARSAPR